ncbi:MAG: DUF2313 domain-containing protein [Oscillospiraceae bacterium]|nr:DUF2313 domain-containing protein [Oscillospiraceae bacterium]
MRDLIDLLPDYYRDSAETRTIIRALQAGLRALWDAADDYAAQLAPDTATWGLARWETMLGLREVTAPVETRRAAVLNRLRSRLAGAAPLIERIATELVGSPVWLDVIPEEYRVVLRTDLFGIPDRLPELIQRIKPLFPAHISWGFGVRHHTWLEIMAAYPTWPDIDGTTWDNMAASNL